jgi:hypothetical protein
MTNIKETTMFDRDGFFVQERICELRAIAEARRSAEDLAAPTQDARGRRTSRRWPAPWPLSVISAILGGPRAA